MNRISSIIVLALVLVLAADSYLAGQERPLSDQIDAQWNRYRQGLKEYQVRYSKSHYDLLTGKQRLNHMTWEYRQAGGWRLWVQEFKEDSIGARSVARAVNSRYAFEIGKQKHTLPWMLREVDLDLSDGIQIASVRQAIGDDLAAVFSPYILGVSGFLPKLLKRPGFSLTKTVAAGTADEGLTKVWFKVVADEISAKQTGSTPIEGVGWLLLDPKCFWRIREFELPFHSPRFPERFKAIAKYEYQMAASDYPVLKQIHMTFFPDLTEKPSSRTVLDFVFEKRVASEEEFTLSAFGLPEPKFSNRPSRLSYPYVWLSAAALACFGLALLMRRRNQKAATHTE